MNISPLAPKDGFPDIAPMDGVEFATTAAGIKYKDRTDVLFAKLAEGTTVAGVFTKSSTRSAPVLDCQAKLQNGGISGPIGLLVNSGNANAFTGSRGSKTVEAICGAVSSSFGVPVGNIFTASTGVIGEPLPHERVEAKMTELGDRMGSASFEDAAKAIMTTDTFPKGKEVVVDIDGTPVRIAGFAKGSGMIAPDMATMLVYIFTDAAVPADRLQAMLSSLNEKSFNAITVDSDTSTSDSLMLFATGASGVDASDSEAFVAALYDVMLNLAHQVVKDGEGATKFVEVRVDNAHDVHDARKVALAIANSPLVKTAIAGEDPNWGRIVMAVGKSGAVADRDKLAISFGDILVAENGWVAESYSEEAGASYMKNSDLIISVDLGVGDAADKVWTCDLTHGYITINADYRS